MANTKVTGDVIANGTISTVHIADDAITAAKLDSTATGITFADLAVSGNSTLTGNLTVNGNFTSQGIDDNADATAITINGNEEVGIGKTSPFAKLHVETTASQIARFSYNSTNYQDLTYEGSNIVGGSHVFKIAGSEKMRIDTSGNVLIGSTSFNTGAFSGSATGINVAGAVPIVLLHETDTDKDGYIGISGSTMFMQTADAIPIRFGTNDVERMRITDAGNIGIGTNSPAVKLHVDGGDLRVRDSGNVSLQITSSTSANSAIQFGDDGDTNDGRIVYENTGDNMLFYTNDSERMRLDSSGNVGINKTNSLSDHKLSILKGSSNQQLGLYYDTSNFAAIGAKSNGDVQIYGYNGSSYRNILLGVDGGSVGGNVGIGTSSPQTYLQIGDYPSNNIDITTYPDVPSEHMIHLSAPETTNRYGAGISFGENSFTAANITAQDAGGNGSLHMLFGTRHTSGIVQERMRITSGGYILTGGRTGVTASWGAGSIEAERGVGAFNSNKTIYLFNNGTDIKLDAYDYGASSALDITIGGNGGDIILDGNVGIGTTSPNYKLEVNGTIGTQDREALQQSQFGYSSTYKVLMLGSSGTNAATTATTISMGVDVSGNAGSSFTGNGREILFRRDTIFLVPNSSNNEYERPLAFNGANVGIGVTSPDNALDIDSSYTNSIQIQGTGSHSLFSYHDSGGVGWATGSGANYTNLIYMHPSTNSIRLYTNGSQAVHIDSSGNVGIGTTSTESKLQIKGCVAMGAAIHDGNPSRSTTNFSQQDGGSLHINWGLGGTTSSGDTITFTYGATSWKSWSLKYNFASTNGICQGVVGGYWNNSGSHTNDTQIDNLGVSVAVTHSGQSNIVTFTFTSLGTHPMANFVYMQSGGDGQPRMDRVTLNAVT